MKTGKLLTKWLAVLCAAILMISLFAIPVFADTAADKDDSVADDAGENNAADDADKDNTADDAGKDSTAGEEDKESTTDGNKAPEKKTDNTALIVWIVVGAVVIIVAVVLCIRFREKIVKGLRVYKSEFKKVSWLSWEQTKKSTLVVVVVLLVCSAIICLLDIALFRGFDLLLDGFRALLS